MTTTNNNMTTSQMSDMMTSSQISTTTTTHPTQHTLGRLSASTLSMRNKKQLKRQANAQHNSNFHAGYVPVTEDVLHRSGIRGRKRYFLYCTISVLLSVAFLNTLVTASLLYFLGMTHDGLGHFEIVNNSGQSFLHFFGPIFASSFRLNGVPIGSRHGADLKISSSNSPININSYKSSSSQSPSLSLTEGIVSVLADDFRVKSKDDNKWVPLNIQTLSKNKGIINYSVGNLTATKVQNVRGVDDIYLESAMNKVKVDGSEAVNVRSHKDMQFTGRDTYLKSENSSIVFQSKRGLYLNTNLRSVSSPSSKRLASKICVCGNGRLFLVPSSSPTACDVGQVMAKSVCL